MKIPEAFFQFDKEKTLIIVTGKQEAKFYLGEKGEFRLEESFKLATPKYSDKEGFCERGGRGQTYGFGSSREAPKEKIRQDFLKNLKSVLKNIEDREKIEAVYLLSPSYILNEVRSSLPADFRKKIKFSLAGHYFNLRPMELLKKIKESGSK
jgi:hypothetical protein